MVFEDIIATVGGTYAHNNLMPELSVSGGLNSPAEQPGGNDPGLNSNGVSSNTEKTTMTFHWGWIVAVLAVLLGLWYFFGRTTTATA